MKSIKSRKQRKELYNAALHQKRKEISAHLDENLILKYDRRSIPVIKGDTVKVMRGSYKGHSDKVANVNVKKRYLQIEGIILTKADGKKIAKPIHASNVMITKLNLTDKWRRKKLERGLSEEARKEIEKEAKEQIREVEEEQKRREAEEAAKEAEMQAEEEEEIIEEPAKKEKPSQKKEEKTAESKPKTTTSSAKKTTSKKTTPKKVEDKKTPSKTKTKGKEEK